MTGTGTQADPYIVTTWAEFVTAGGTAGAYCKQGKDIDMNEDLPQGIASRITIQCAEYDGNGREIRNAYFIETGDLYLTNSAIIKNFKLINFYNARNDSAKGGAIYLHRAAVTGLTISGFVVTAHKWAIFTPGDQRITGLSANLDGPGGGLAGDGAWDSLSVENGTIQLNGGRLISVYLRNCRVIGKVKEASLSASDKYEYPSASIIDAEITDSLSGPSGMTAVLYNSEKIGPGVTPSQYFTAGVTEEQLHDAAYLRGLGFPIGVD